MEALIIPTSPDSLASIRKYVTEAADAAGLAKKAGDRLQLAVGELAAHLIGRMQAGAHVRGMLRVQAQIDAQSLQLILEDSGAWDDPRQPSSQLLVDASLERRLSLMIQVVDDFRYERLGDWNRSIFVMNRPESSAGNVPTNNKLADDLIHVILPIGIALSGERDLDRLLENILIQAKRVCNADGGTLYLPEDNYLKFAIMRNESLNIAMGGATGEKMPDLKVPLFEETSREPNYHNVASYVALRGQSVNIPDVYNVKDFDFSGTRAFDQRNNYRSISTFTTPLKDHEGEVIGVLQLLNAQDSHTGQVIPFDPYMQQLVEALASQAAVVLNNRRLLERQKELLIYEHELQIGQQIQADFLPDELPQLSGWEIAASFRPAHKVAGDFYDAFYVEDGRKICLIVADVCDKGVGAALFMALTRSLIRAFAEQNENTTEGRNNPVELTNDYILRNHSRTNMFVTLFYGVLDLTSGQLTYVNCGHNPPVIIGSGDVKAHLQPTGPAVGVFPNLGLKFQQVNLEPEDLLFAFTDGLPEAHDVEGNFFSNERTLELLEQPVASAEALLERLGTSVRSHIGAALQFDDITMMAVRRKSVPAVAPK
jgi:phosphoserine phosphatase RsbU/P